VRNPRLHGYLSFAGSLLETAAKSLHLSCGSELHAVRSFERRRLYVRLIAQMPAFCGTHGLALARRRTTVEIFRSRAVVTGSLSVAQDFPRYCPWIFRKIRVGFTDMSRIARNGSLRSGASCGLPDKEFRYLRTVHLLRLITEGRDWLPTLHVAMQLGLSHR
jgi:hypothetical protein